MGDWWERHAGAAIPLGGIAVRRDLGPETCSAIDAVIRESVRYAWAQYPQLPPFVTSNAQEMNEAVMRQHIELYVNEYTEDLGPAGEHAIRVLFQKAAEAGLIPPQDIARIFY
jgi:1,4-dihydroxy-6-naphthoate synthase